MKSQQFDLDKVLIDLSAKNHTASWTIRDAVEGLQVFGGIGSGKTSGTGKTIALKYLSNGFGGLVLTAKHDEKELWQDYCRQAGRLQDLIIMEPGSGYYFNFMEYESTKAGSRSALTLNLVQVLKTVINASRERTGRGQEDSFWEGALDMVLANSIDLCLLAYDKVTVPMLYEIAQSAPKKTTAPIIPAGSRNEPKVSTETPQTDSQNTATIKPVKPFNVAFDIAMQKINVMVQAWKNQQSPERLNRIKSDIEFTRMVSEDVNDVRVMGFVNHFFTDTLKNIAEKTRSIIDFNVIGFLYNLLREPTYSLFCRYPSNVTPEDCLKGKIILLNLPVKDYHKAGQDAQVMFKYIWQRAMERRRIKENGRPVFLWADEAQHFLHEHDAAYQATARSSRIATVYISQNLPNYFANMGGQASEYKVKSFLGTLGTKIFHANADIETNQYASNLAGQAYVKKDQFSKTVAGEFSSSKSYSYDLEALMRPEEFAGLKTGGPSNHFLVEGVMHTQGKQIARETNFKKISFNQHYSL